MLHRLILLVAILVAILALNTANWQNATATELTRLQHEMQLYTAKHEDLKIKYEDLSERHERIQRIFSDLGLENMYAMEVTATAYAPSDNKSGICADEDPTITATGTPAVPGVVAVNPKVIPFGSRVYVQSRGWLRAEDSGANIRKRKDLIDILVESHDEAVTLGNEKTNILIIP